KMEPIKTYKMKEKAVNMQIYGGVILMLICLFSFFALQETMFLGYFGLSLFFLIIGLINRNRDVFKCYDDYLEAKIAPASKLHLIKYADIVKIEKKKKVTRLYYTLDGKEKKLLISGNITKEDLEDLLQFLNEKMDS